ncbi:Orotidine 5'-phosphate decarboxylase [Candidatus Izimaplasma bacterium HR1]|jgi:orotidine-5'-phosphate decarboxylase|uniref:orotidine-5'-phosphate decarboxylase n=1 Tax=Candidatus Izimoplasma sp. HR1 TaxID=1541959 RepID=UPI0004F8EBA7|nr:Orotidine 5'-phosphate decarboxylase [Candidatus Izimaplasma bacterium HR1]
MKNVIIACDFKDKEELNSFLNKMPNKRPFLKIGMELFYKEGPLLIKELKQKGYKIFLDLKLHDIPTTVYKAMKNIALLDVELTNIHASGGVKMMEYAKKAIDEVGSSTILIAVTQLTSTSDEALKDELLINTPMNETIKHYAKNTKKAGLVGVVCSPLEAPIMNELGLISVTPGIRFSSNNADDQVRVSTPALAKELGSTYIVVGRSITKADNPVEAYEKCLKEFL